uniref:Uncharacterized protein n=1 Tax=Otus sunia TaxID=257818 RepID=A0A8C8BFK5_9STRI
MLTITRDLQKSSAELILSQGFCKSDHVVSTLELSGVIQTPGSSLTALLQFGKLLHQSSREGRGVWGSKEEMGSVPVGSSEKALKI